MDSMLLEVLRNHVCKVAISLIRHARRTYPFGTSGVLKARGLYVRLQPTNHLQFQASHFKSLENLDSLYSYSALEKDVSFHRIFYSLHPSPSRSIDSLSPHRSRTPHSVSSDQGPHSHKARCGLLHTALFIPWIPLDNRGHRHPPRSWGISPCSIYLHRCTGPGLEEGTPFLTRK